MHVPDNWIRNELLMATAAVLPWAVHVNSKGFDVNTIGVILFIIGLLGMLATLVVSLARRDRDYGGYVAPVHVRTAI
jgi:hypothetical protein